MPKIKPCLFRNLLFTLGLGLGLLLTAPSNCLGLAVSTTSFYVENHWQLSFPASDSLLNPEKNLQLEPALTGLFLLHGGREWLFKNGGRFVFADTVQLRLDRKEPELGNRLNELYFALNPTDNFFLDLGKQVVGGGVGYFLNPAGLWPEQTALRQDRTLPPEGKVLIRGEYLFPHLTLEVGWAPPLEWAEDEDGFIQRYFGSAQKTALAWVLTSGGLAGVDLSLLLSPGKQWKTGLSLAKVWGDQLETHAEIGWAERNDRQVEQVNKLFCALIQEATGVCPPPIKATTEKSHLKVLVGGHYTFTGGENLILEYFFNGTGLTRQEWERVLQSLTVNTMSTLEAGTHPLVTARRQKAAAFLTEAGFPGLLRHYAMARFYKELLPTLALEQIVLHNLVDGSGLALVLLNYEKELFSFVFGVQMPYGKRASEFGLLAEERQVKLQIKVDF